MVLDNRSPTLLCFGTFEVDVRAGELRKQGLRVKIQEQPFHVLTLLLQRPGELVSREELRSQIWHSDTFVDFDKGLNTSINRLREALGDSADNPRFIETLPRRGYRFIAQVTSNDAKASVIPKGTWAKTLGMRAILSTTAILAIGALLSGLLWRWRQVRRLTERDTIVLADFTNTTGDPVFDGTLRQGLSVQLGQSPFLSLVSEEGVHQTLRMMGQSANARLTPEIAREVCERTRSAAVLDGSIALLGTQYYLVLSAINCASGDLLASAEARADDKSHVLDALGNAASELRRKLGESLNTLQKYNTPLEQATTPSLEALQAYSLGLKTFGAGDSTAALPFFQRATQLDPNFAMAFWAMANSYSNIGETTLAAESMRKAFALRAGVSESRGSGPSL